MTDSLKYGLSVLAVLLAIFLFNRQSQKSYTATGSAIFTGEPEDVHRVLITEAENSLELVRTDTTWTITQADSLLIKENQIDNLFDRLLAVHQEMLISRKEEKWEKFGVDDSLGRHLQIFDESGVELLHYVFGNSGQDYQHNYIRKSNSPEVYRTNDNVYFLLNYRPTYWGKIPPKPTPEEKDTKIDTASARYPT
jgi:hypothetical protein